MVINVSMLVFFPWLKLRDSLHVGDFTLIPYKRGSEPVGPGAPLQEVLDTITKPYLGQAEQPIGYATLVQVGQGDLTHDLDEQQRTAVFVFSELLTACGLSCREYFQSGGMMYWNRDNFRLVVQQFADPHGGVTITTRRRDGSTLSYWSEDAYHVQKPDHVPLGGDIHVDERLLEALLRARESKTWDRLWASVVSFDFANTDSAYMAGETEAVLLSGAFERLLDCDRGKENELAERFSRALTRRKDVTVADCVRLSSLDISKKFRKSASIRDMWIRDFFRLRGDLAHGRLSAGYSPAWSLLNHLLLGSYVFPLVLKSVLAGNGLYTLEEGDQFRIDLFESLACEEHFGPGTDKHDRGAYAWNRVIDCASREETKRRAVEILRSLREGREI